MPRPATAQKSIPTPGHALVSLDGHELQTLHRLIAGASVRLRAPRQKLQGDNMEGVTWRMSFYIKKNVILDFVPDSLLI